MYLAKSRICCCLCLKLVRWGRYWRIPFYFAESMNIKVVNKSFCAIDLKNLHKPSPSQHFPSEEFFCYHSQQFSRVFFQEGAGSKSLALPELSFKKLNHMLMTQGSWPECRKAFCSLLEIKAASPAALLWLPTQLGCLEQKLRIPVLKKAPFPPASVWPKFSPVDVSQPCRVHFARPDAG